MERRPWLSGLAVAAAVLLGSEGLLRAYFAWTRRAPAAAGVIWAIGDSNTQGMGAPPGRAYPDELARLLGQPVVNLGVAGSNSAQAVTVLAERLARGQRPTTVLALCGVNDDQNVLGVDPDVAAGASPRFRLRRALQGLRLAQLLRAALSAARGPGAYDLLVVRDYDSLRARRSRWRARSELLCLTAADLGAGDFAVERESLRRALAAPPDAGVEVFPQLEEPLLRAESDRLAAMEAGRTAGFAVSEPPARPLLGLKTFLLGRGWSLFSAGRLDEAAQDFSRALALLRPAGEESPAYEGLGWVELRRARPAAARRDFERALAAAPPNTVRGRLFWSHAGLAAAAAQTGEWAAESAADAALPAPRPACAPEREAASVLAASARLRDRRAPSRLLPVTSYLETHPYQLVTARVDGGFLRRALDHSFGRLAALSAEHGFRALVLTYPQAGAVELNSLIREMARARALTVLELEGVLGPAGSRAFVSADGYHPNAAGYTLIAHRVAEALRAPSPPASRPSSSISPRPSRSSAP